MLSFSESLAFSEAQWLGSGQAGSALAFQPPSHASQTSLLGTPQGQLLLSLTAPPRWGPGSN